MKKVKNKPYRVTMDGWDDGLFVVRTRVVYAKDFTGAIFEANKVTSEEAERMLEGGTEDITKMTIKQIEDISGEIPEVVYERD